MRGRHLTTLALTTLLVGANVVCFNLLFGKTRGLRADLTDDRLYTLAPETVALLQEPEEPLEIFYYFTAIEKQHDKLRPIVGRLGDKLKEFEAASNGKVTTRLVEWDELKDDDPLRKRAVDEFGVKAVPIPVQTADEDTIRNTYFSVVVSYGDQFERFDAAQLWRVVAAGQDIVVELENVEYLVAKAINKVLRGFNSVGAALATADLNATIDFYFSPEAELPEHLRKVPGYAKKVAEKLKADAGGRLTTTIEDPTGDDPEKVRVRERLAKLGLSDLQLDPSKPGFYSYALVKVGKGPQTFLPLFTLGEEMTESDVREGVAGALKQLTPGFLTTIGLVTGEPDEDPMARMMGRQPPPQEFSELRDALAAEFEVKSVDLKSGKPVPRDVAVLLLLRPSDLSERALYELDQFVMRGGRLVACVDPVGFSMSDYMATRQFQPKKTPLGRLKDLLKHYGADVQESYVLDVSSLVLEQQEQEFVGGRSVPTYTRRKRPFVLVPPDDAIDARHPVTARLRNLVFSHAAPVELAVARPAAESRPAEPGVPEGVVGSVIIRSSPEAEATADVDRGSLASRLGFSPPPAAKSYGLAVALQGKFPSFFAGKPIPPPPGKEGVEPASRPSEEGRALKVSTDTSIVVFGDADFVSPMLQLFRLTAAQTRPNLALLRNALDFGGDAQRLMGLRGREEVRRPLTALAKMDAAERAESQDAARRTALVVPIVALALFGAAWFVLRRARPAPAAAAAPASSPTVPGGAS